MRLTRRCTRCSTAALVLFAVACGGGGGGDGDGGGGDGTPPVLSVTPVDLTGPYSVARDAFGDVTFSHRDAVIPFGDELTPGVDNMAFEYYTVPGAPARACCAAVVVFMFQNEGQSDYEIHTRPSRDSTWVIQYDHVTNPTVAENDTIVAGQVLMRHRELLTLDEGAIKAKARELAGKLWKRV